MIKLGIIGPGLIWEMTHRQILAQLDDRFTVVAVAARSEKNQERGRQAYPQAHIYSTADELIADPAVEATVILTPIALNAPVALKTLSAGKHAIVEKPLARSVTEGLELLKQSESGTAVLYILEQHVHKSLLHFLKQTIEEGTIGQPVSFERSVHCRIAAAADDQTGGFGDTEWRQMPDYPLGNFFDGGIHEVALLSELFGPVRSVFARGRSLRDGFGNMDLISMNLGYDGGIQGSFVHSAFLGQQEGVFIIRGTEASLRCSDSTVVRIDSTGGEEQVLNFPRKNENLSMWEEAAQVIHRKKTPTYTIPHAVDDLRMLEAVEKSIQTEQVIHLGRLS